MATLTPPLVLRTPPGPGPAAPPVPPLEQGDRLTREEFLRRYHAMPELKKAELIEGRVYVASPVSSRGHARPHLLVVTWLGTYLAATPKVDGGDNGTTILDLDNLPQPDAYLRLEPAHGGQSRVGDDDFVHGAPELVVEVAATSASYDLHEKLSTYRRSGVREYVVWRTLDGQVDWFALEGSDYVPMQPGEGGLFRSRVFPGLWLDAAALIRRDLAAVLRVAQQGLASPEHAELVKRLGA